MAKKTEKKITLPIALRLLKAQTMCSAILRDQVADKERNFRSVVEEYNRRVGGLNCTIQSLRGSKDFWQERALRYERYILLPWYIRIFRRSPIYV